MIVVGGRDVRLTNLRKIFSSEVGRGVTIEDFTLTNVPARVARRGDLWKPVLAAGTRFDT